MKYLLDVATILGVKVTYGDLSRLGRDGDYNHARQTIRLQSGMPYRLKRSVLAHELGHAVHGDVREGREAGIARQERRADEWAALTLIALEDFEAAEVAWGGHVPSMAVELGVIVDLVVVYQRMLARLGDAVYLRPRMGAGQWVRKEHVA